MHPLLDNPFFVLELPASSTSIEAERQARKLLSMLELSLPRAQTYATPRGPRARTPEGVRTALQILLDPVKRLPFEPWAEAASLSVVVDDPAAPACGAKDAGLDPRGMTWWQR